MSAYFEGSKEDFYIFLGPRTSDLIHKISKPYRKKQKSCTDKDENGKVCGKWKSLDAAHLKDRTRIIIINEILEEFGKKNIEQNTYNISLEKFETEFHNKHKDFFSVIKFRCRKHHRAYDKENKVEDLKDDVVVETEETYNPDFQLDFNTKSDEIKKFVLSKSSYLDINNCRIARVSTKNWNFNLNVKDLKKDFYLICYNQIDFSVEVLRIRKNTFKIKPKNSNEDLISLNIPYSESEFIEKKTKYKFDFIESLELKP